MRISAALHHLLEHDAPKAPDLPTLETWGRALGALLPRPVIVTFSGELGAGKTTLVRAVCAGLGVGDLGAVTSPTFALIHEYIAVDGPVTHVDLYRLRSTRELDTLGWDELVATSSVLLIEWPDRAVDALPRDVLAIELRHDPEHPDHRLLTVTTPGTMRA